MTEGVCIHLRRPGVIGTGPLEDGMARVDVAGVGEEVSVELVEAPAGDVVPVHARVAIGRLP